MKIKHMTDAKLHSLIDAAQSELALRKSKVQAVHQLKEAIKKSGYTIEELFGNSKKYGKVAPKWRHKEDKSLTWAGRGRQPKWIKKYGVKV